MERTNKKLETGESACTPLGGKHGFMTSRWPRTSEGEVTVDVKIKEHDLRGCHSSTNIEDGTGWMDVMCYSSSIVSVAYSKVTVLFLLLSCIKTINRMMKNDAKL